MFLWLTIVIVIATFLAFVGSREDVFVVTRDIQINAPAEKIFPLINNLRNNKDWSPFENDPDMKRTFSGPEEGAGAVFEWEGNTKTGAGRLEILESVPSIRIVSRLDMYRPMKATNDIAFVFDELADGTTRLTWSMAGEQPFLGKLVNVFINCDKMVGREFEKGLAAIKRLAEN